MEQGVISRPSILLTATDSELQLAFTSSLFLESSSASLSLQSCFLCSAQDDEGSGQPWAVAVKPLGTSAGRVGDSHLQQC